jgi:hypothetical protein
MARENSGWGYDRIVGALENLGHRLSDQTVKNILRRHGVAPAPKRSQVTSWKDFLARAVCLSVTSTRHRNGFGEVFERTLRGDLEESWMDGTESKNYGPGTGVLQHSENGSSIDFIRCRWILRAKL